ncbi:MAG: alginate export family protein [Halioglobus sp.]
MRSIKHQLVVSALSITFLPFASVAKGDSAGTPFIHGGEASLSNRLRYETADDSTLADADALTLRSALRLKSGPVAANPNWSALVEIENTALLSSSDFSTGARNRGTVVIADQSHTEINQLYLSYQSPRGFGARLGRQEISYGDERFVGSVSFRQNHQSFDAASLSYTNEESWALSYAYVANVNRIFGDESENGPAGLLGDHEQDTHLLNGVYSGGAFGELEAYGYLIDNKDFERASTDTWGLRFSGSVKPQRITFSYTAELANQRSADSNPADYETWYSRVKAGVSYLRLSLTLGQERLGSDNGSGFVTPFATLHRYQGWADKFVALTPNEGLIDTNLTLAGRFPGFRYRLQYNEFSTDKGSNTIGKELGAHVQWRIKQKYLVELKYADYQANKGALNATGVAGLSSDTRRLFVSIAARFGVD